MGLNIVTFSSNKVTKRNISFSKKIKTKITKELFSEHNPYLVESMRIYGYDHMDLIEKCEVSDVIFLLLRGDLPNYTQSKLFRKLFIALINPGPRHPASQASILAGVGKTLSVHMMPISLSVYGGDYDGAGRVENAIKIYNRHIKDSAADFIGKFRCSLQDGELGFGRLYGGRDPYAEKILVALSSEYGDTLKWVLSVHDSLSDENVGVLRSGVCAAALCDLGFLPYQGASVMQLFSSPGLLAHGLEYANKPITDMVFEDDDMYEIEI